MTDKLRKAIEVLKKVRHWIDYGAGELETTANTVIEAIDTVVSHCENPTYTKDRIIEILVTTKALTEHLSQDERNEFFEKAIKYWEATE